MIVPLELRNDFHNHGDNNKIYNNYDDENDNVNSDSLNPHDDFFLFYGFSLYILDSLIDD